MEYEIGCQGCYHMGKCLTAHKVCPCRICLVKVMCQRFCYERHIVGAKSLKLRPLSEEAFVAFQKNNLEGNF